MITCPKCGFRDHVKGAGFCQNCGQQIGKNYCVNLKCPKGPNADIPDSALYCPYCGEKSYFSNIGIYPESGVFLEE